MKLLGTIAKQQVLILVDSGSIGTFISHTLVQKLQLSTESCDESHYKSASGGTMICNSMVKQLPWLVQGHTFLSDAKVLNLQCYDMILGQDWLETYSPMWIHWGKKMMRFTHRNKRISLQGVTDNNSKCPPVSATKLQGLLKHGAIEGISLCHLGLCGSPPRTGFSFSFDQHLRPCMVLAAWWLLQLQHIGILD